MTIEERPTIAEVYGLAATRGAQCDIIAAAGMQSSRLGAMLLRLQAEYDGIRVDLERAGHIRPRGVEQARELRERARLCLATARQAENFIDSDAMERRAAALIAEAKGIEEQRAPAEIVSARAFILTELKTLAETKKAIGVLAVRMAKKRGVELEPAVRLAGRVLDVYLDPMCHHCDGTGETGSGYRGEQRLQCRACRGSTHRRDILGNRQEETALAADLFAELQRQAAAAARMIGAALGPATGPISTLPDQQLRDRLDELRSAEAEKD